jgi:hypothetical protein
MLWDIYDEHDDDCSSYGVNPDPYRQIPDGVGDTLWDEYSDILNSMCTRTVNDSHPENMHEFWTAWFAPTSFGHLHAMRDIWYEHGQCCVGPRGNVDDDRNDLIEISDLVYLIDYSFANGPAPTCMEEADVNGDGTVDVGDVTYLIDYSFGTPPGPPPVNCE